jgi:surface antigen
MNPRFVALTLAIFLMGAWIPSPAGAGSQGRGHGAKAKHEAQHSNHQHPAKHSEAGYHHVKGGPPPWAPAHGYRRKHGAGGKYVAPFGIDIGTCDRSVLGAALGGAAGGLLASELAQGDDRTVAIVGGTLLGILVGGAIGDSMDRVDHGCLGQVLEHSPPRETVRWNNPDRRTAYEVTPTDTYREEDGRYCREYQTTIAIDGKLERAHGTACRQPDGSWQRAG